MTSRRDRKRMEKARRNANPSSNPLRPAVPYKNQVEEKTTNDSSIIRHGAGNLETFELKESELEKIEHYTWGGRFFDFGINCVTVAATLIASMATSNNMDASIKAYFTFALFLCIGGAIIFFLLAYNRSQERSEFFKKIRNRE